MAAKKKPSKAKKKAAIEANFRVDSDFGEQIKEKFKEWSKEDCCQEHNHHHVSGSCGWIYFLGIVGSAFHFIGQAEGFWNGALGLLKALVWPAMLVYQWLEQLARL